MKYYITAALLLLSSCTKPRVWEFHYGDEIRVNEGFYKGCVLIIQDIGIRDDDGDSYIVDIKCRNKTIFNKEVIIKKAIE